MTADKTKIVIPGPNTITIYSENLSLLNVATASRARASNVATLVTSTVHGFLAGDQIYICLLGGTGYNGYYVIATVPTTTSLTYANTGANESVTGDTAGRISNKIIGHTEDGAVINFKYSYKELKTHNSGDNAIGSVCSGLNVSFEIKACEFDRQMIRKLGFPFATHAASDFAQAEVDIMGEICKILNSIRIHLDADEADETHDWVLNMVELKNDSVKIVDKIGEKWVVDIKGECLYLDTADSFLYGVPV